jgi:hypothetical protein
MTSVTRLDGVGPALEDRLDDAGFRNLERIAHGNALEIDRVEGASGGELVLAAQEFLDDRDLWTRRCLVRRADRTLVCDHCREFETSDLRGPTLPTHQKRCAENPEAPDRFK